MNTRLFNATVTISINFLLLFFSYQTQAQHSQTEKKYLSGTDKDHTVDWEFFCTDGRNSGEWTTIPVPSHWELEGFGTYNYGRDKPYEEQADEKGLYKHRFTVNPSWKDRNIFIVFEGSMTDTEVKINGKSAGPVHQGAFYRFKYDISDLLNFGEENLLEVTVSKRSANKSVNEAERYADYWIFGGIFRPVFLESHPEQFIEHLAVDAKADGSLQAKVQLANLRGATEVEAQVRNLNGELVGESFSAKVNPRRPQVSLQGQISDPDLWSAEFPNLYQLEIKLKNENGTLHEISEKFGFRTVELRKNDGFYVNGEKIRFKGVNRHSFWPSSGRTTSPEISLQDVQLMKEMNMNAVRMSHYPPDKHFLEVCDSLGMYVINELTGWQQAYDTGVGKKLVKELVSRDVNHPSVVMWANGNEGGNNHELVDDYAKYDPQKRPVIHPWAIFRGTDTQHYKPYDCCTGSLFYGREVFFPTEFLHGLYDGGHGAGLDDYWNQMLQNPLSAGGFLWDYVDQAVVRTDKGDILDTNRSNAPDGIVGPYREKEGSFFAIREIWSPIYIGQEHLAPSFNKQLKIENRYHHTNLSQCNFDWKLVNFPHPGETSTQPITAKSGKVNAPDIAPGQTGLLELLLPANWRNHHALYLTATDPHGREIFTWTWPIQTPAEIAQSTMDRIANKRSDNRSNKQKASGHSDGQFVYLKANGIELTFNKENGLLEEVKNAITSISFRNGPILATEEATFKELRHYQDKDDYVLEVLYEGAMQKAVYRMLANGWLRMEYEYLPKGEFDYLGVNFDYPEEKVTGVKWLGRGPYRVWKNRMKGMAFGTWQKDYNDAITGETWEYPEFKGYHSNLFWAVIENEEYPITVMSATEDIFLRLFTPTPPEGAYNDNTAPPFPEGDISFMNGISPIGTKFLQAEQLGPQGQKNKFYYHRDPKPLGAVLYFDFGAGKKQ
jgi:hypothetical protein